MCLTIKKGQRFLIAKTDIVCYKILINRKKGLKTFFRHEPIKLGNVYYSNISRRITKYSESIIEKAIHSFVDYIEVKKFYNYQIKFSMAENLKIIKCIIPKGSKYIKGEFDIYEGYASDCLTYLESVNE